MTLPVGVFLIFSSLALWSIILVLFNILGTFAIAGIVAVLVFIFWDKIKEWVGQVYRAL